MEFAENLHVFPLLLQADITTTATGTPFVNMSNNLWAEFLVYFGAITGDTCDVTVEECTANTTASGAAEVAIPFQYRLSSTMGADSLGAVTTSDSAGMAMTASDDDKVLIVEVDPATMDDGYNFVRVKLTPAGSMSSCLVGAIALLHPRYAQVDEISSS